MLITWSGISCFKIQTKDIILVTDPFDASYGLKPPRLKADIVTISHAHHDHDNVSAIMANPFVINGPGEYEIKGIFVYGLPGYHDKKQGAERGLITMYLIEMEDISLAHLGDLGCPLNDEQLEKLEGVDILMIPVGGRYTIDAKEAVEVINQIEPRIVIPMHYKIPGLKFKNPIDPVDNFCKEMGIKKIEGLDKLKIAKKDLPAEETKVIILKS
jgi:L-ascorbate metabolism protein UlaG (beta-lactamase superfamily)